MAIATGLISSLFNITSSLDVLFYNPKQLDLLNRSSTKVLPKFTFFSPLYSIAFSMMASVRYAVRELWLQC